MQSNSDNNNECVAAAMVAALVTRRPATNEAPSHNMMGVYLDKLKELVPQCPKNRNVSKLELIQHVIDYINDLQEALQNGSDSDSPPASPSTADPVSFSEAFSHLSFDEDGSVRGFKTFSSPDEWSYGGGAAAAAYTSDGSSDYDSRGSSPINHQSDAEYSSDEFSPCIPQHFNSGSPFYPTHISHMAPAAPLSYNSAPYSLASDSQRRVYRKGYGLPANHSG